MAENIGELKAYLGIDTKGVDQAEKKMKGFEKSSVVSLGKVAAAVGVMVAAWATYKTASLVKETALLAARNETLSVVMHTVGKNAGYSAEQMDHYAKSLQKTGISIIESKSNVVKLTQAQLDLTKSSDLARVAQDAAVIGNINSSEAFSRLVHGIQAAQVEVLRTIGINVQFEEGYKKLAAQLGITSDKLTSNQKAQSRLNQVLEYGERIAGTYENAMTTAGKKLGSFTRYVEDFKVKMGEAFGPATVILVDKMTDIMKDWQDQISTPEAQQALEDMANQMANIAANAGDIVKNLRPAIALIEKISKYASLRSVYGTEKEGRKLFAPEGDYGNKRYKEFARAGLFEKQAMVDAEKARLKQVEEEVARAAADGMIEAKKVEAEIKENVQVEVDLIPKWAGSTFATGTIGANEDMFGLWAQKDKAKQRAMRKSAKEEELLNDIRLAAMEDQQRDIAQVNQYYEKQASLLGTLNVSDEERKSILAGLAKQQQAALQQVEETYKKYTTAGEEERLSQVRLAAMEGQQRAIQQVTTFYDKQRAVLDDLNITDMERKELLSGLADQEKAALDQIAATYENAADKSSDALLKEHQLTQVRLAAMQDQQRAIEEVNIYYDKQREILSNLNVSDKERAELLAGLSEQQKNDLAQLTKSFIDAVAEEEKLSMVRLAAMDEQRRSIQKVNIYYDKQREVLSTLTMDEIERAEILKGLATEQEAALERIEESYKKTSNNVSEYWIQAQRNMQSVTANWIYNVWEGQKEDFLDSFIDMLQRMISEWAAAQAMMAIFGNGKTGADKESGLLGIALNAFTGTSKYASGGMIYEPVAGIGLNTGRSYNFGESGPESISPMNGGGGGGGDHYEITVNAMDSKSFTDMINSNQEAVVVTVKKALKSGDSELLNLTGGNG